MWSIIALIAVTMLVFPFIADNCASTIGVKLDKRANIIAALVVVICAIVLRLYNVLLMEAIAAAAGAVMIQLFSKIKIAKSVVISIVSCFVTLLVVWPLVVLIFGSLLASGRQ